MAHPTNTMALVLILSAIAIGCSSEGAGTVASDAASDAASEAVSDVGSDALKPISLDGPYPCGSSTCTSGQVCLQQVSGVSPDAGGGTISTCVTPPASCNNFYECSTCPNECAGKLCDSVGGTGGGYVSVSGRTIACVRP